MHTYIRTLLGLILWFLTVAIVSADPPELMPVDDIRPGMKGVGKTVFSGTTVEEFDVEILAVMKNDGQPGDAILAKVSGGPLPLEKVGVVAGMSGSPIYIDGKLIGALAFGYAFDQEPMIAGITPIHEMLADANRQRPTATMQGTSILPGPESIRPIHTPLVVSGIDSRVLTLMEAKLAPYAILPLQGGSATQGILQEYSPELEPGAAVGVQLIRGDMNASGIGTVTYRDDDRVLAFGHPMMWAGSVSLPMTSAYVHFVWTNQVLPFKVASPLHTVGSITQDRKTGISGQLGVVPAMVPLDVTVRYEDSQYPDQQYTFEVVDHPLLTPIFLGAAGANAVLAAEGPLGEVTVTTRAMLTFNGYPPVVMEDVATGDQQLIASVFQALAPVGMLLNNPFTPVSLQHVSLEMTVAHEIRKADLVGIRIDHDVVRAGEVMDIMIDLQPYGHSEIYTLAEQLTIPETLQQEPVQLVVCDVNMTNLIEVARATGKFQPRNLEQAITLLNERASQHQLVLSLLQIKPGLVVQGRELPAPPLSMMALMGASKRHTGQNSMTRGRMLMKKYISTPYVISGCTALPLLVDHSGEYRAGSDTVLIR